MVMVVLAANVISGGLDYNHNFTTSIIGAKYVLTVRLFKIMYIGNTKWPLNLRSLESNIIFYSNDD